MRNTAPCILYSALKIHNENPDGVMIIAPSDHWIDDEVEFLKNIQTSFDFCSDNDALMTLGIKPSSPNTGYGYIQFENSQKEIKKVSNFTEKPNLETPENNQDYDVLKVAMSSDGVIVSSPTKYTNRVQDKYATSLTDAEIDVLLPLNRFQ